MGSEKAADISSRPVSRALLTLVAFEISSSLAVLMLWMLLLELADPGVMVPLLVVRALVSIAYLHRLLAPAQTFLRRRADSQPSERLLLAADEALRQVFRRFRVMISGSWALALLVSLLPAFGVPYDRPLAAAELLTAMMMTIAVTIGTWSSLRNILQSTLHPARFEVSHDLLERGLEPRREQSSLARYVTANHLATATVLLIAGCAVATLSRVETARTEALGQQLRRADVAAARLGAPLEEGVSILETAELPAALAASDDAQVGETLGVFDPRSERVMAAVALGGGRWTFAEAEPNEQLGLTMIFITTFCTIVLIVAGLTSAALGRAVAEPISELDAAARQVIEVGQLGRITRIVPLRDDEVGALAKTFNTMLDTLDELALAAQAVVKGDLRTKIDRPGDLPDAFRAMLGHLHDMVVRMRETTLELASAAAEILAATETQGVAAEQQAASIGQVSATTSMLAESAKQITTAAASVRDNAEQSMATALTTAARIEVLDLETRGIRELLALIHEIAERSDLLALNGSLEAVRAAEAGRGFGLVATEMRRLAERVSGAVHEIRGRVDDIETSASSTVTATQHSRTLAENTADVAREINDAIVEQSARTQDAASGTREVAAAIAAFSQATDQTRSTAESLRAHAAHLELMTRGFEL